MHVFSMKYHSVYAVCSMKCVRHDIFTHTRSLSLSHSLSFSLILSHSLSYTHTQPVKVVRSMFQFLLSRLHRMLLRFDHIYTMNDRCDGSVKKSTLSVKKGKDSSNGMKYGPLGMCAKLYPVLPAQLNALSEAEFGAILDEHRPRLVQQFGDLAGKFEEKVSAEFSGLQQALQRDSYMRDQLIEVCVCLCVCAHMHLVYVVGGFITRILYSTHTHAQENKRSETCVGKTCKTFKERWSLVSNMFPTLMEFCAGLATAYPVSE
jgi:hypothetical protein